MPRITKPKKTTNTPAPPKKSAAKKTASAKKTSPAKTRKASAPEPPKKTAKKTAALKEGTKVESKALGGQGLPRDIDERGFVKGSDSAKIAEVLVSGGKDRNDINEKIRKALGNKTETIHGNRYNVSSAVAAVLNKMQDSGWTVQSNWVLSPPTPASKRAATRRKSKQATDSAPKVAKRARKA